LYISRKIAELHEGELEAHSEGKGKGATFTARFATVSAENLDGAAPGPEPGEAVPPSGASSLRILLVEDHEDSNRSLTRILEILGHRVRPTRNTKEAKQAAQGGRFDLLISDLGLPDGDGAQLMHELKRAYGLKGIALSGYGTAEDRQRTATAGFSEHLVKPVNIQELEAAIARTTEAATR
jgi:CheY-like chemotaxis protein